MNRPIHAALALLTLAGMTPAQADDVFNDDVIVTQDLLCVGLDCADGEAEIPGRAGLKVKEVRPAIRLEDTSSAAFPNNDWQLNANEPSGGMRNAFYISDMTNGTNPFWIEAGAPDNAFFLDDEGQLGLGTALPQDQLHIVDLAPSVRFETPAGNMSEIGRLSGNTFYVYDHDTVAYPFAITAGAPNGAINVAADGDIGLGTVLPEGKLHTKGDGVQLAYFESGDGGPVQVRFRTDSENRRFLAVNNANEVKSQLIFLDDRINFTGETDSGANLWLSVGPDGIVSQGPDCDTPCDAVFDPEVFEVPDIEARAAQMWAQKHLPAIGPTKPHAPINLTEKMGGVIHELEVAHIYIEELHERLEAQETQKASLADRVARQASRLAEQTSRNAALEARLDALEARIRPHGD